MFDQPKLFISLLVLLLVFSGILLTSSCMPKPDTSKHVRQYQTKLDDTRQQTLQEGDPKLASSLENFGNFLQKISDQSFIKENTAKVYAPNAYLNDTLVTHHGPEEIMAYFLTTAQTMSYYQVTIEDTASSGNNHYVRWKMTFSAPKLNGGKPVESIGMSHVRFNQEGQVILHQDFWDSGLNIYGQLPVLGGIIENIRRRFE